MRRDAAIDLSQVANEITVNLRVQGVKRFAVRCWLLGLIMRLAQAISPVDLQLIEEDAPPTSYDVAVRLYGNDRIFTVGDRQVRIPLREAIYFGEMILAGWTAEVRNAAVHVEHVRGA